MNQTYFRGSDTDKEPLAYCEFKLMAVKDPEASLREGRVIMKDEPFAYIYPRGGKDKVKKKVLTPDGQLNPDLAGYREHYEAWKRGEEGPVDGTDIRNFAVLTPAQIENFRAFKIMTVEQLAEANEETIKNIGHGARAMKQKAQDYLKFGQNGGKVAEEMSELRANLEAQKLENEQLREQLQELDALVKDMRGKGKRKGSGE